MVNDDINELDYILSVDIFSEGVDVPEINQVIMLRPTQSPIVFIQQLGRGLRKAEDKEYVVILDFIGNYKNNFMIPIALSGDRSYNKDNVRKYVVSGNSLIPGASTIHFDEISKERIFNAVDNLKSMKALIKESYTSLKNRLGRIPRLVDFYENEELIAITKELADTLRKNRTIDWQKRDSARARMRMMIKRLLKKHRYPPEGMDDAVQTVMTQCELWTDNNDMELAQKRTDIYRYSQKPDLGKVAEESVPYGN